MKGVIKMLKGHETLVSIIVVIVFGFTLFFIGTDGFKAFTAETARTNKLIEQKPALPLVTLEDSLGEQYSFDEFNGKYILMTFIYTACSTVCPMLEKNVSNIYEQVPEMYLGEDIVFLSISFDTERDTPEVLARYGEFFGSDADKWRMARVPDDDELKTLLDEFGVIAIPDGEGDFQHNVAYYLVDKEGYLLDVIDFEDVEGATSRVLEVLKYRKEG